MAKVRRKHHETRIFTLNNPTAPRLCPELAIEIGLNESILLLQLEFWISISGHERDGQLWTYQSLRDIQATFPFWKSVATVKTVVDSLVAKNLIFIANHNQRSNDKTQWFAINLEEVAKLKSISVAVQNLNGVFENRTTCSESEQGCSESERPVQNLNNVTREYPETTPESTQNNNIECDEGSALRPPGVAQRSTSGPKGKTKPLEKWGAAAAAIYEAYPRHTGKQPALVAIAKALDRIEKGTIADKPDGVMEWPPLCAHSWLLERTKSYALERQGKEEQFTPHPATWFNQARYTDASKSKRRLTDAELDALAAKYAKPQEESIHG